MALEGPVDVGERLWAGEGISVWATNLADRLVLRWENPAACEAACGLQRLLKRHALPSTYLDRLGSRSVLIRRVTPLPLDLVAAAGPGETTLTYEGANGEVLSPEALRAVAGVTPSRLEMMADAATHAARSLRAHLTPFGTERLRLVMRFGLTDEGQCLPQVVNPLNCDLGTADMDELAMRLGG